MQNENDALVDLAKRLLSIGATSFKLDGFEVTFAAIAVADAVTKSDPAERQPSREDLMFFSSESNQESDEG